MFAARWDEVLAAAVRIGHTLAAECSHEGAAAGTMRLSAINKLAMRLGRTAVRLLRDVPNWPGEYFGAPPIVVLSFNRPHYLRPTLESLRQQEPGIDPDRVHLFQDGAVNRYSGVRYADDGAIEACVALLKEIFPRGHVHASTANIGTCENFLRAERFAFETLKAPVAYFFEDDLVLSPHYVAALDVLRRALCGRRVGYFNACGSFGSPLAEQSARHDQLIDMGHLWGFGLKRSHWLAMQPRLAPYHALVVGRDYRQGPRDAIQAYFRTLGLSMEATSQDAAKVLVTQSLGSWQASTFPCFARYIGKEGLHFTEAKFERYGLHNTVVYPDPLREVRVSRQAIRSGLKNRRRAFKRLLRAHLRREQRRAEAASQTARQA